MYSAKTIANDIRKFILETLPSRSIEELRDCDKNSKAINKSKKKGKDKKFVPAPIIKIDGRVIDWQFYIDNAKRREFESTESGGPSPMKKPKNDNW